MAAAAVVDGASAPALQVLVTVLVVELLQVLLRRFAVARAATPPPRIAELRSEIPKLRRTVQTISPQDEFTRWARTQRELDRKTLELEKLANELHATVQSRTARVERALAWLGGALHLGLVVMLRGQAVVYVPPAWVTPLGWLLALPGAPAGSVSAVWWIAICRSVVRRLLAPLQAPVTQLGTSNPLGAMLAM